jgi:hypothetical protein
MDDIFTIIFVLLALNVGGILKLKIDYNFSWRTVIITNIIFSLAWIVVVMFL